MLYYYFIYTYFDFFIFLFFCILISILMLLLCFIVSNQNLYSEKISGYECGFNPFSDARDPFNIKFYLISILFILFDIETLFFFPWSLIISIINIQDFFIMYFFYIILLLGYIYEWKKNCINLD